MYQKVFIQCAADVAEDIHAMCSRWPQKVIVQYAADVSEGNCTICRGWNQMIVQCMVSEGNYYSVPRRCYQKVILLVQCAADGTRR